MLGGRPTTPLGGPTLRRPHTRDRMRRPYPSKSRNPIFTQSHLEAIYVELPRSDVDYALCLEWRIRRRLARDELRKSDGSWVRANSRVFVGPSGTSPTARLVLPLAYGAGFKIFEGYGPVY